MKELTQRLQSEKIPNEEKPVEKVKFFAEEVREKIQNEKNPEEKPKNTVQSGSFTYYISTLGGEGGFVKCL